MSVRIPARLRGTDKLTHWLNKLRDYCEANEVKSIIGGKVDRGSSGTMIRIDSRLSGLTQSNPETAGNFKPSLNGNVFSIYINAIETESGIVEDIYIAGNFSWYGISTSLGGVQYSRSGFARLNVGLGLTPASYWYSPDDPTVLLSIFVTGMCPCNHNGLSPAGTVDSIFTVGYFNKVNDGGIDVGGGGVGTGGTNTRAAMLEMQTGQLYVDPFDSGTADPNFGVFAPFKARGVLQLPVDPDVFPDTPGGVLLMIYGVSEWNGNDVIGMAMFATDGTWIDTNGVATPQWGWTSPNTGDGITNGPTCPVVRRPSDGGFYYASSGLGFFRWKGTAGASGSSADGVFLIDATGTLDATFDTNIGSGCNSPIRHIAMQADEKLVIVGLFTAWDGTGRSGICRLNTDGTLDTSFDPGSGFDFGSGADGPQCVVIQEDGKILVCGGFRSYNGSSSPSYKHIIRLNDDGTIDTSFNADVTSTGDDGSIEMMAVKSGGDIIITENATMTLGGKTRIGIALLRSDGFCYGPT